MHAPRVSVLPGDGLRFARFAPDPALAGVVESYWTLDVQRPPAELTVLPDVEPRRVTLLGDAAHLMPPQRGLGGNSALEYARVLADALATNESIVDAVSAYPTLPRAVPPRADQRRP